MSSADDRIERVARAICGRDLEWRDCESACLTAGKCVGNLSECVIDLARAAIAAAQSDGLVEAERAIRITVWNFLKDRGAKDEACYPIIEGAVTSFRAALPAPAHPSTPSSEER